MYTDTHTHSHRSSSEVFAHTTSLCTPFPKWWMLNWSWDHGRTIHRFRIYLAVLVNTISQQDELRFRLRYMLSTTDDEYQSFEKSWFLFFMSVLSQCVSSEKFWQLFKKCINCFQHLTFLYSLSTMQRVVKRSDLKSFVMRLKSYHGYGYGSKCYRDCMNFWDFCLPCSATFLCPYRCFGSKKNQTSYHCGPVFVNRQMTHKQCLRKD